MGLNLKENPLIEKINALKQRFATADSTDQWVIGEWEEQAKTAILQTSAGENEGVKMIIQHVAQEVKEINIVLLSAKSSELSDSDRDRMLDMKNFYKWFLSFFLDAKAKVAEIDANVENELTPTP